LEIDSRVKRIVKYSTSPTPALLQIGNGNGKGMKDLISDIVKALVDQPDQVTVTGIEGGQTVVLELSVVAKSDVGKVIGKKARNALALRTILSAAAGKVRKRYVLEIVE
jgi:predicted RNA-binding protein YlqC (UPF0109 family)